MFLKLYRVTHALMILVELAKSFDTDLMLQKNCILSTAASPEFDTHPSFVSPWSNHSNLTPSDFILLLQTYSHTHISHYP